MAARLAVAIVIILAFAANVAPVLAAQEQPAAPPPAGREPGAQAAPEGAAASRAAEAPDASTPKVEYRELFSDKGRVFPACLADPREAQFRLGFLRTSDNHTDWDFGFGADIALLRSRGADGREFSFTIRGLIQPRFRFDGSLDLLNTDFRGGVAWGTMLDGKGCELFLYHESSHLGDDVIERGERENNDYSKESLRFLVTRRFSDLRVYAGPSYNLRAKPDDLRRALTLQCGAEQWYKIRTQPAYVALDLQSKQENDWAVTAALQVGIELGDPKVVARRHRVFVEFFTGHSNMGQFVNETESYVMLGVGYNF